MTCSFHNHSSETRCPQGDVTIRLRWHLGREGSLIFQPQTKAPDPNRQQMEAGRCFNAGVMSPARCRGREQLSRPESKQGASSLAVLLSHQCWGYPLIFSPFTHPTDSSAHRSEVAKRLPTQERSLTVHRWCERTLPGRAPGMTSRTSYCRASFTEVLQHLCNSPATRSALDTDVSELRLQSKRHLLPHIYPLGSNCGATGMPQIHTGAYPKVTCPGHQGPLMRSRLLHVQ